MESGHSTHGLRLHGFNNLTKNLSFNIYDVCYAASEADLRSYVHYIDEQYNAERLTDILRKVAQIIDANILNVARADYVPHGASVTMMISEGGGADVSAQKQELRAVPMSEAVVAHLDKSHLTVHTYPETHPSIGISTFRADIDVSTCGMISPLKALNFLLRSFDSDIVSIDYRVRGFTRDTDGLKHYIDHDITSVQDYLDEQIRALYHAVDINLYEQKLFHTKMRVREFDLDQYLFNCNAADLDSAEHERISHCLQQEIAEIFEGRNHRSY